MRHRGSARASGARTRFKRVMAVLAGVSLGLAVGVTPASAFSLYDSSVQSSLRNLASAVEMYAMMNGSGDYTAMTVSGLKDWGWSPDPNASTVIHVVDSGHGWWASMQDVRGSSEYLYESGDYVGSGVGSVAKAAYQPTVNAASAGTVILDSESEIDTMALYRKIIASGMTANALCDELVFLPGSHELRGSATDEAMMCNTMAAEGKGVSEIFRMLVQMGAAGTLEALAVDILDGNEQVRIPDHSIPWTERIPNKLWADVWKTRAKRLTAIGIAAAEALEIERYCISDVLKGVVASDGHTSATRECSTASVFVSGGDNANEASEHDLEAIWANPGWVHLNYLQPEDRGNRHWYSSEPECTTNVVANTDCDEFPFFSTFQGGGQAVPRPSLKRISSSSNRSQGASLSHFYRTCGISPGEGFYIIPVPLSVTGGLPYPTGGVCDVDE